MAIGIIVLLGYFTRLDFLVSLRAVLLEWASILVAVALLAGVANLVYVHWRKLTANPASGASRLTGFYSLVLILSLIGTVVVVGWYGPTHAYSLWIFNNIQLPVEASLMAILAVVLIYMGVRLLRRRQNLMTFVFLGTALVLLLLSGPLFGIDLPGLIELRAWIARVPAVAGARGVLLGVALGIVGAGLRVLVGADRPYGG
jgi:hypothetical protein